MSDQINSNPNHNPPQPPTHRKSLLVQDKLKKEMFKNVSKGVYDIAFEKMKELV